MPSLEAIIGLEVHAQVSTKTKMFCSCPIDTFGKLPNTAACPICMGHPGTLPVPNAEVLMKAAKAARALKCALAVDHHLNRKNYFYPDLPAGFQISQYDYPLAKDGEVRFGEQEHCRILRLHVENDAGKLTHAHSRSYCDFNRAGTPLMEIVTQPDLRSPKEAVAFAKELQRILIAVGASEADMYKGMMRFDASISLRPKGEHKLYPRSEIKNLNSFKALEKALTAEEKKLRELWAQGKPPVKEVTIHWDDERETGLILRDKESAADYRYFPEPDIPPFHFDEAFLDMVEAGIDELPHERKARYRGMGLREAEATMLIDDPALAAFFDAVAASTDAKRAASTVLTQLLGYLKAASKTLSEGPTPEHIVALLKRVDTGAISTNTAKKVLETMVITGKSAEEIAGEEELTTVAGEVELQALVAEAIEKNPKALADVRAGNMKALGALIGYVMKKTEGRADPTKVNELLNRCL